MNCKIIFNYVFTITAYVIVKVEVVIVKEIWREIDGYNERYSVSNLGNVRSNDERRIVYCKDGRVMNKLIKGKILAKFENKGSVKGYIAHKVGLSLKGKTKWFLVHRLVAEYFCDNPNAYTEVNHKDGNPFNNIFTNLEWISRKDNVIHAMDNGLMNFEKPVVQLDKNGDVFRIYRNEKQACLHHGIKSNGKVARAINLNRRFHGFYWR